MVGVGVAAQLLQLLRAQVGAEAGVEGVQKPILLWAPVLILVGQGVAWEALRTGLQQQLLPVPQCLQDLQPYCPLQMPCCPLQGWQGHQQGCSGCVSESHGGMQPEQLRLGQH